MEKGEKYTNKISEHPLQTWQWGEFRKAWGNEILFTKYGLLTLHKIPFVNKRVGNFIRGPEPNKEMLGWLKTEGRKLNLILIKLEPFVRKNKKLVSLMKESGCEKGKTLFTPTSFWLDLTKSEEELMKSFSSKTRYNIRLAEKKGVRVYEDNSDKAFNAYLKLTQETVERQGFYAHNKKYHKLMWKYLKKDIAHLMIAKYQGEIITTWILFAWKDFLFYPYGASSQKYKNVMANNLMMWEAIKLGKKLDKKKFDLWGREEGKGFTKFKEGYNPEVVEFLGTWDLVIDKPFYYLYRVVDFARWRVLRIKSRFVKPRF